MVFLQPGPERQNQSAENEDIGKTRVPKLPSLMNIGDSKFWGS